MTDTRKVCALTTIDNPYNPITDYDHWFMYDNACGYGTGSYLARIVRLHDAMSDGEYDAEIERAIDEIVAMEPGIYKKVVA